MNDTLPSCRDPKQTSPPLRPKRSRRRLTRAQPASSRTGPRRPRRLLRSSSDLVIAGVSGGLGTQLPASTRSSSGSDRVLLISLRRPRGARISAVRRLRPDGRRPGRGTAPRRRLQGTGFWRAAGLVVIGVLGHRRAVRACGRRGVRGGARVGVPTAIVIIVIGALLALAAFRGALADPPGGRAGRRRRRRGRGGPRLPGRHRRAHRQPLS